jgi:hypothetical protein
MTLLHSLEATALVLFWDLGLVTLLAAAGLAAGRRFGS